MRYTNPETNLNLAVVQFMLQCAATRSLDVLAEMQVAAEDIREFTKMRGEDIARLSLVNVPLFEIKFNREVWQRVRPGLLQHAEQRELRDELVCRGAPRAMIERWWPMRHNEFAWLRRELGIKGTGRARQLTEAEEHQLWEAWLQITAGKPIEETCAEDYLTLHKQTNIDLRGAWSATNRWANEGYLGPEKRRTGS